MTLDRFRKSYKTRQCFAFGSPKESCPNVLGCGFFRSSKCLNILLVPGFGKLRAPKASRMQKACLHTGNNRSKTLKTTLMLNAHSEFQYSYHPRKTMRSCTIFFCYCKDDNAEETFREIRSCIGSPIGCISNLDFVIVSYKKMYRQASSQTSSSGASGSTLSS